MRVLSLEELELVAGGSTTNDPGYNVGADVPGDPVATPPADPGAGGAGGAGSGGSGGGGGGGGGGLGSGEGEPGWAAHTPEQIHVVNEVLAKGLANNIISNPDHHTTEFDALIYKDQQGNIHTTDLVRGASNNAYIGLPTGVTAADIIGVVHNHPSALDMGNTTSAHLNEFPSTDKYAAVKGQSDWNTADQLVQHGADASQLTLFILDGNDTLREYNYADRDRYQNITPTTQPGHVVPDQVMPNY